MGEMCYHPAVVPLSKVSIWKEREIERRKREGDSWHCRQLNKDRFLPEIHMQIGYKRKKRGTSLTPLSPSFAHPGRRLKVWKRRKIGSIDPCLFDHSPTSKQPQAVSDGWQFGRLGFIGSTARHGIAVLPRDWTHPNPFIDNFTLWNINFFSTKYPTVFVLLRKQRKASVTGFY